MNTAPDSYWVIDATTNAQCPCPFSAALPAVFARSRWGVLPWNGGEHGEREPLPPHGLFPTHTCKERRTLLEVAMTHPPRVQTTECQ